MEMSLMARSIKFVAAAAIAVALSLTAGETSADAGGFSLRIGNYGGYGGYGGYGYNSYRSAYRGSSLSYGRSLGSPYVSGYRGTGYRSYAPAYNYHPRTPHYDYHPPTVIRHRGHYDVVPGHYDFHYRGHGHHGHRGH